MSVILVTGGAGFIGSHVCEALLDQGNSVISLDNYNDFYDPELKHANTEIIRHTAEDSAGSFWVEEGDIRDEEFLDEVFTRYTPDAVVHLAAYAGVRPSIENPELYMDVNLMGTTSLLETMKDHGVKRHVFASSSSVYGNNKKVPFSEKDPVDEAISPYAATKKAGEVLCHTYYHLYGINTACLRFFTVYGPRQRPDLAISKFLRLITEEQSIPFYGDGSTERDYTYIDDIVHGVLRALDWTESEESRFDIFNLGNSSPVSLSMLVEMIEKIAGKKATLDRYPLPAGDVDRTFADIVKAKELLGYAPQTPLEDGLRKQWLGEI